MMKETEKIYSHLLTIASITSSPSSETRSALSNTEEAVPELILMSLIKHVLKEFSILFLYMPCHCWHFHSLIH